MTVHITGLGIVSALGDHVEANLLALREKRTGIRENENGVFVAAVAQSNAALKEQLGLGTAALSRTSLLGMAAARQAWEGHAYDPTIRTGFISATSVGGMDRTEDYYAQLLAEKAVDAQMLLTHDSGNTTEKIAQYLGIRGYINTLSTACSSGANAIMLGARLIQQGRLDRVLCGASDPLIDFTIAGFNSLMIYDSQWCRPFDESRAGLNLGEGAAYVLLESEACRARTGSKSRALVTGWCNASDAFHQTASSPDGKGATLAIQGALETAQLSPGDISYINAHGTATKNNDESESTALKNVFGDSVPPFSSTKAFTGHTLAAAGAIEAVYSVLAIENNAILPGLNYKEPIASTQLVPQTEYEVIDNVSTALSNSFGFGGNNTTLIFSQSQN